MVDQIRNIIAAGERTKRDVFFQAAGGVVEDVHVVHRHGVGQRTNTGFETIWDLPGSYPRILSAAPIELVSTSIEDHAAGSGARKVLVNGCDHEGGPLFEIVEMDGLDPVQTINNFFWMDFAHVIEAGSKYGGAEGLITLTHTGSILGGDDPRVGVIPLGINRTCNAIAVVPNHFSGYILDHTITAPFNKTINYGWRVSNWPDNGADGSERTIAFPGNAGPGGPWASWSRAPERIHFPSLVEMVALVDSANTSVTGAFTLLAIHDKYDFSIPEELLNGPVEDIIAFIKKHPETVTMLGSVMRGFHN